MLLGFFMLVVVYFSSRNNYLIDTTSGYFSKPQVRICRQCLKMSKNQEQNGRQLKPYSVYREVTNVIKRRLYCSDCAICVL